MAGIVHKIEEMFHGDKKDEKKEESQSAVYNQVISCRNLLTVQSVWVLPRKEAKVQYLLSEIDEVVKTKDEVLKEYYEEKKRLQQKVLGYYPTAYKVSRPFLFSGSGLMYIAYLMSKKLSVYM
ncbi:hypothetical protein R1flu_013283 [Riccia fluitans]|uniref:Uncharacterized protein n=1 Tax=Riccia fluitans TaxID=41844 RepID=A0ABD1YGH5_9MARC